MTMRLWLAALAVCSSAAYCQTPAVSSGAATSHGSCSPANSGNRNVFSITCGIGKEQGDKMIAILNRIIGSQLDPAAVMAKLDDIQKEMERLKNQPSSVNNCPSGICVSGGTVDHPTVNNTYTTQPSPPRLTWTAEGIGGIPNTNPTMDNPDAKHPGVKVTITVAGRFQFPMFAVICDRACAATEIVVAGASAPKLYTTNRPNAAVAGFGGMPAFVDAGTTVWVTVRSKDDQPIRVTEVGPYVAPQ